MSWEATSWVMDKSQHKGYSLFAMLLAGNNVNTEGRGQFSMEWLLVEKTRVTRRTAQRTQARLEKSGEIVCEVRGTGHEISQWFIPGVIRDGYAHGGRGVKLTPQGRQVVIPGASKRRPRGVRMTPISLTSPKEPTIPPPTPAEAPAENGGGGGLPASLAADPHLQDFRDMLKEQCPGLDARGQDHLLRKCVAACPEATLADITRACLYKCATAEGARNKPGLLIRTVPAILAGEKEVVA